jgi:hypothetical protein
VHPYFTNDEVRAYGQKHGIVTEAWSPIAQGAVLDDQVVDGIAKATGKSPAQVVLRWHVQRGDIVFPKGLLINNTLIFRAGLTRLARGCSSIHRGTRGGGGWCVRRRASARR